MRVEKLTISNFRNHEHFKAHFDKDINLVIGKNGAGKTNILEAIFFMSTTISHRTGSTSDLILKGKDSFSISGKIRDGEMGMDISLSYSKGKGFNAKLNSSKVSRSGLISRFPVVMFAPEDIEMIQGPPEKLRRVINVVMSQIDPAYMRLLIDYNKALVDRNIVLKERDNNSGKDRHLILKTWTNSVNGYALKVSSRRREFTEILNETVHDVIDEIGIKDTIELKYWERPFLGEESIARDIRFAHTTWGPHRETLCFFMNGKNVRKFSSRGEARMAVLVFRLAVWKILKKKIGKQPVVLLDDIFSELDEEKRKLIAARLNNVQSIIATTEIPDDIKGHNISVVAI